MSDKYVWREGMGEISGFGGGYEDTCRAMVRAGCEWLDAHPEAKPEFRGYKNIYGIISEENDDAKALTKAIVDASGGDCTGAMHQASVTHVLQIHAHDWEWYCAEMSKQDSDKEAESA